MNNWWHRNIPDPEAILVCLTLLCIAALFSLMVFK